MKKKMLFFILLFLFGITSVHAASPFIEVNGTTYTSFSSAFSNIEDNTKTTVKFIKNYTGGVTIPKEKNLVFDLNGYTINNNSNTVITNNGILEIKNGTVSCGAGSGAINNNSTGVLTVSSGTIEATGTRQALYNKGGKVTITGDAYLESATSERATVHNLNNGTMNITGGTIVASNSYAVYNDKGTLNIGTKDEFYDKTTPVIQGKTYGVIANDKFNMYDGIVKGSTYHIGTADSANAPTVADDINETKIKDIEEFSEKLLDQEVIGEVTYKTFTYDLDNSKIAKVTFNANGGEVSPTYKRMLKGETIGELPIPIRTNHTFDGWFTDLDGGNQINEETLINKDETYYAHWTYYDPNTVAYVEGIGYMSLENAVATGGNIRLEKDVIVPSSLVMNKEATLDLNGHTITLNDNMIGVYEKVTILDSSSDKRGKITSTASFTIIVGSPTTSTNGYLIHKSGTIEGLGAYGAIRNYEKLEIDGGTVQGTATDNCNVIYNDNDFVMNSGTVYSTNGRAVQVYKNSTFTMNGGLIKTDAEYDQAINLYGDCSATINGGSIEGLNNETAGIAMFKNTNLEVNGGIIKGCSMAVAGNGSDNSSNANITINAGELISTNGVGMYLPQQNSTTIINGGKISGLTGIEIRASDLIINDGIIIGTNDVYEVKKDGNGTTTKGAAIGISQHSTKKPINVTINGGTFDSTVALCNVNPLNNPLESISLVSVNIKQGDFISSDETIVVGDNVPKTKFISGGTYTTDPSQYVIDGYGAAKIADDKYEVTKNHKVIIDSNSSKYISTEKDEYPYKSVVEIKNNRNLKLIIEVRDIDGNLIEVTDNKFIMPDKDVTIKTSYKELINPITGDNVIIFISILAISSVVLFIKKRINIKFN